MCRWIILVIVKDNYEKETYKMNFDKRVQKIQGRLKLATVCISNY